MLVSRLRRSRLRRGFTYFGGWGTCCCAAPGICVVVCVSSIPLAGAVVTITGVGSCTTNAAGCCPSLVASGTHAYSVVVNGDTVASGSWNFSSSSTITISGPANGKCCQGTYMPNTMTCTDSVGSFTMKFWQFNGAGDPQWTGGHNVTKSSSPDCLTTSSGPVPVCYTLTCVGTGSPGKWTLQRLWDFALLAGGAKVLWQENFTFTPGTTCNFGGADNCMSTFPPDSVTASTNTATASPFSATFSGFTPDHTLQTSDPIGGSATVSQ